MTIKKSSTSKQKATADKVAPEVVDATLAQVQAADTDAQMQGSTSSVQQYVTFMVGDEVFAVDMAPVQEIIRVPEVVRVPLSPPSLDGLANLRGKVLPIISLRHIFRMDNKTNDDATRAVVIDFGNQPLGFVVDKVASVIEAGDDKLETVDAVGQTINTELLTGLLKNVGGHEMIMVLNFEELIKNEFARIAAVVKNANNLENLGNNNNPQTTEEKTSDELQLVSFTVDSQDYAISIEDVQEIVQVPENIVKVPHSQSHVLGIMTLRNRLLPLVSLRSMFGMPSQGADEHSRIVVVTLGDLSVGVVTDTVNEVLRIAKSEVENMPQLLARESNMSDITQICRLEGGKRLVSVISAANMFNHASIQEALNSMKDMQQDTIEDFSKEATKQSELTDDEQLVIFSLDAEEFGVPIESVQEIVRVPDMLTHVPKTPDYVEGVINLRGTVLPVIDQRSRLGIDKAERNDRQRIMVFLLEGVRTGFIVDAVTEVLKINKGDIEPAPQLSGEQAKLISRVANLEKQKRMIQLLEPAHLLEKSALTELASLAA